MEITRLQIIFITGLLALAVRAVPQLYIVGEKFSDAWDRWLRYLSYGFICSIISVTLFMSGARIEAAPAPRRAIGLALAILIAYKTKSAVTGMIGGAVLVLVLAWVF